MFTLAKSRALCIQQISMTAPITRIIHFSCVKRTATSSMLNCAQILVSMEVQAKVITVNFRKFVCVMVSLAVVG